MHFANRKQRKLLQYIFVNPIQRVFFARYEKFFRVEFNNKKKVVRASHFARKSKKKR